MKRDPILTKVFAAYGSAAVLSRELGISRQCVGQWKRLPLKYVREVSKRTGISPDQLRPDIYAEI
jgi:Putative antitoxin of bacterial toxin-antitoxin system, YdaS/YdaT